MSLNHTKSIVYHFKLHTKYSFEHLRACRLTFMNFNFFRWLYSPSIFEILNLSESFKIYYCGKSQHFGTRKIPKCWKRRGPGNPDDPFNKFWKILNSGSIFPRKHEVDILDNLEYGISMNWKFVISIEWKSWIQDNVTCAWTPNRVLLQSWGGTKTWQPFRAERLS